MTLQVWTTQPALQLLWFVTVFIVLVQDLMYPKLALKSPFSCLYLPSARIFRYVPITNFLLQMSQVYMFLKNSPFILSLLVLPLSLMYTFPFQLHEHFFFEVLSSLSDTRVGGKATY